MADEIRGTSIRPIFGTPQAVPKAATQAPAVYVPARDSVNLSTAARADRPLSIGGNPYAQDPPPQAPRVSRLGVPRPAMLWIPANTQDQRSGAPIDTIILHHTNSHGTPQADAAFFANPETKVSSHYIVGKDGTIIECVPDEALAHHAGTSKFDGREDVNDFSLGIEMVNEGDGKDPYTDAQYEAMGRLMAYLQTQYGIPWERVTGHKNVAVPAGRKDDPSSNFSYARLKAEVTKALGRAAGQPG